MLEERLNKNKIKVNSEKIQYNQKENKDKIQANLISQK